MTGFANVLLPLALAGAYSYRVPEGMALVPGSYVEVPLGPRAVIGVVWRLESEAATEKKLRDVTRVFDLPALPEPALPVQPRPV